MKCFALAKREIMHDAHCEISRVARCEMIFAHVRRSEHFTFSEKIFHREAISLARKGKYRCVPALWQARQAGLFVLFKSAGIIILLTKILYNAII